MTATADKNKGTSALASLTADVMGEKITAGKRSLTPVAGEAPMRAALPNDTGLFLSNEALREHAVQLRKFAADAITIADGLDALVTSDTLPSSAEAVAPKASDKMADQKQKEFEADLRAKERAAQAATFAPDDDVDAEGEPDESPALLLPIAIADELPAGWVCPDHGKAVMKTSPKGRDYRGCPDCKKFEL